MSTEFLKSLSTDFIKLLFNANDYNVIIKIGESSFKAHSCVLRARSPYFYSALSKEWATKEGNVIVFEKPNVTPKIFEKILSFLYSGTISLEQEHPTILLDLLTAADELILLELFTYVKVHLFENHSKWIRQHPLQVLYHTAYRLENYVELRDLCLEVICENPELVFGTRAFTAIEESVLISILKRDDLQMDEVDLWDYLIQWGIAHTFTSCDDNPFITSEWTQPDFLKLKETLKNCVPFIRFNHINNRDLPQRLKPFEKLLPKYTKSLQENNYNNNEFGMIKYNVSNNIGNNYPIDSKIIKLKHAALIARWIDRQEDANIREYRKTPIYDFKLLLRGSQDDFSANTFHRLCDNKDATIVVMRISDTKEIIGGYNPVSWKGGFFGSWMELHDSFIFSLGDGENNLQESTKLCRIKKEHVNMAVFCANMRGPCFGNHDLWMANFNNLSVNCDSESNYYDGKITESRNFDIKDYEVFQIIEKKKK